MDFYSYKEKSLPRKHINEFCSQAANKGFYNIQKRIIQITNTRVYICIVYIQFFMLQNKQNWKI